MATKQISELPLGVVDVDHEVPTQQLGTTYKLSIAGIKDWILAQWSSVYDPTSIAKSPFARANHTGTQPITTVDNALNKTGDTVTGVLLLPTADPTVANQAATKAYVDKAAGGFPDAVADGALYGRMNNAWSKALPLAGGTVTGALVANAGMTIAGGLNVQSGGMTVTGTLNAGANAITCGPLTSSGQVYGNTGYFGGLTTTSATVTYLTCNSVLSINSAGLNCVYSGVNFQFSDNIAWNRINVTNSSYAILIGFAGTSYYTFQTDRFAPMSSGGPVLGTSSQRWDRVYSVNADSVSSDAKLKQDVRPFSAVEIAVAKEIKNYIRMFRMKASPDKLHAGVIAQDMETLFAEYGLDIRQYAFYEIDEDMSYTTDAEGQSVETPTGEYTRSIVYSELLVWMIAAME